LLIEQCADNLPNCKYEDEYKLEHIRFQVLMISGGNIEKLHKAVQLANEDWRDLNAEAGSVSKFMRELLGDDLERNKHSEMMLHGTYLQILIILVSFLSSFFLKYKQASTFEFGWFIFAAACICVAQVFISLWRDRYFREHSGVGGIIAMTFLGTVMYVGFPAVLGFIAAIVTKSFI
jgi:hypothetical protein